MFWSGPDDAAPERPPLGDRVRDALALARALLTLEDDYDVDWDFGGEASRDEQTPARRPQPRRRRPGAPPPACQVCLTPVAPREQANGHAIARAR